MIDHYYTYILASKRRGALYIGTTHALAERVLEHKYQRVEGITSWYNINQLVYYEAHPDFEAAAAREQSLKALLREAKVQLIDAANPDWTDLYPDISNTNPDTLEGVHAKTQRTPGTQSNEGGVTTSDLATI